MAHETTTPKPKRRIRSTMTKIDRSGAPAEEEEDDSSYDDESMSSSSSSVSYESGEGSSFSDGEESFTSSSASANGSDEEASYSSSSQHSRNSSDYSDDDNSSSSVHDDKIDNDGASKTINSPSSLIATTDSSNTASPSPASVVATNRTFQRGVLPISISSNGHAGVTGISNNVLTHRRGKKSLESDISQTHPTQCRHENEKMQTDNDSDRDNHQRRRKRSSNRHRKHSKHQKQQQQHGIIKCCINYICCQTKKRSTQILIAAFYLWLMAQFYYFFYYDLTKYLAVNTKELYDEFFGPTDGDNDRYSGTSGYITNDYFHDYSNKYTKKMTPEEMVRLRKQRVKEAREALGSAAMEEDEDDDGFDKEGYLEDSGGRRKNKDRSRRNRKQKSRDEEGFTTKERLKEGCSPLKWHSYHFPNCNEIHEIDLRAVVRDPRDSFIRQTTSAAASDDSNANASTSFPWGFVSNGLWRDVFSCDPRGEVTSSVESPISPMPPVVLKIMKREHNYDQRNFQRHRRDALVMERLSSSHHLVPIYGYCANTVLTQAISHTLDDVIYARENERKMKWNPRNGYQTKPPLESWMGKDENGELLATRETELGRINLALGVFRGLMDLHEGDGATDMEWLPVVHADLQAKQYLVDSDTGKVYLNDFNRCRFIGKKDSQIPDASNVTLATNADTNDATHIQSCPIYIPTAPGYSRSPEEYNGAPLTEKVDIYSAGNILYGIITGNKPFNGERGKHIKEDIQSGKPPKVDAAIRDADGTVDAELSRLLDRVYEADPEKRASAKEVVVALEQLLEIVLAKIEDGGEESIESINEEQNMETTN
ncbi:hypothetical protein ACHAWT_005502 [Skeletonema menzelii]